jgi:co-chaperonin GroES (HSP10)
MEAVEIKDFETETAPLSDVERRAKYEAMFLPIGMTTAPFARDNLGHMILPPVPFQATQWRVGVLMLRPPERTKSGIAIVTETADTEALMSNVGILVSMGQNAFKSVTRAGIDLAAEPCNPKLGDYVVFAQHAGNVLTMRGESPDTHEPVDVQFRIMNDSDILGVTRTPFAFRFYL